MLNTSSSSKPKGVRLGYMGHLMLISEDVITSLARFPPDLRLIIIQYAPEPEWDQYVTGRYNETKEEDARLLGGGKPVVVRGGGVMQWKVDENDLDAGGGSGTGAGGAGNGNGNGKGGGGGELKGEFRRAGSVGPSSGHVTSTADFGPAPMVEDEDDDDSVLPGRATHVRILLLLLLLLYCKISKIHPYFFPLVRSISSSRDIFRSFRVVI